MPLAPQIQRGFPVAIVRNANLLTCLLTYVAYLFTYNRPTYKILYMSFVILLFYHTYLVFPSE